MAKAFRCDNCKEFWELVLNHAPFTLTPDPGVATWGDQDELLFCSWGCVGAYATGRVRVH